MMQDYYQILGIPSTATQAEIKAAYRSLALRYHPDRNPEGVDIFKDINEAYSVLKDELKKRQYDSGLISDWQPEFVEFFEVCFGALL